VQDGTADAVYAPSMRWQHSRRLGARGRGPARHGERLRPREGAIRLHAKHRRWTVAAGAARRGTKAQNMTPNTTAFLLIKAREGPGLNFVK
jgi:hypothetical protein